MRQQQNNNIEGQRNSLLLCVRSITSHFKTAAKKSSRRLLSESGRISQVVTTTTGRTNYSQRRERLHVNDRQRSLRKKDLRTGPNFVTARLFGGDCAVTILDEHIVTGGDAHTTCISRVDRETMQVWGQNKCKIYATSILRFKFRTHTLIKHPSYCPIRIGG